MSLDLYLAFVAATAVLMAIPGPNVALIVAGSVGQGVRHGLATVAGTSTAMVVQLGVVMLGMTSLLGRLGGWFEWVRWVGVVYLLYLGERAWRAPPADLAGVRPPAGSLRRVFGRGVLVSLTNPKTLFFLGAFFPQFINAHAPLGPQLAILSATFLGLAMLMDSAWAIFAGRLRGLVQGRGRLTNRISGSVFVAAGLGLAAVRRST
jgi:threonine/homoserine/homoserine lactone efflux protein